MSPDIIKDCKKFGIPTGPFTPKEFIEAAVIEQRELELAKLQKPAQVVLEENGNGNSKLNVSQVDANKDNGNGHKSNESKGVYFPPVTPITLNRMDDLRGLPQEPLKVYKNGGPSIDLNLQPMTRFSVNIASNIPLGSGVEKPNGNGHTNFNPTEKKIVEAEIKPEERTINAILSGKPVDSISFSVVKLTKSLESAPDLRINVWEREGDSGADILLPGNKSCLRFVGGNPKGNSGWYLKDWTTQTETRLNPNEAEKILKDSFPTNSTESKDVNQKRVGDGGTIVDHISSRRERDGELQEQLKAYEESVKVNSESPFKNNKRHDMVEARRETIEGAKNNVYYRSARREYLTKFEGFSTEGFAFDEVTKKIATDLGTLGISISEVRMDVSDRRYQNGNPDFIKVSIPGYAPVFVQYNYDGSVLGYNIQDNGKIGVFDGGIANLFGKAEKVLTDKLNSDGSNAAVLRSEVEYAIDDQRRLKEVSLKNIDGKERKFKVN